MVIHPQTYPQKMWISIQLIIHQWLTTNTAIDLKTIKKIHPLLVLCWVDKLIANNRLSS